MEPKRKIKTVIKHLSLGALVPAVFLFNAFVVPEPYSHPLIHVAIAPTNLMPFLENRELMHELTLLFFGRMTPNYAPMTIIFLIAFWFAIGLIGSLIIRHITGHKKMPNKANSTRTQCSLTLALRRLFAPRYTP